MTTVTRGPLRWVRAALNAARNPNSQAAKLYRTRVKNAELLADAARVDGSDGPYEHVKRTVDRTRRPKFYRDYTTCSVYCTVMQAQLEINSLTLTGIQRYFARIGEYGKPAYFFARPRDLTQMRVARVRCQCCGRSIRRPKV